MLVSLIAEPGWWYESGIDSLPHWGPEELAKADRILWSRTPCYTREEAQQMLAKAKQELANQARAVSRNRD